MKTEYARLEQLAIEAKSHRRGSTERQKAVTQLRNKIKQSGILARQKENYPPEMYCDVLSKTILDICCNIDLYDPAKSDFAIWVAQILESHLEETINSSIK